MPAQKRRSICGCWSAVACGVGQASRGVWQLAITFTASWPTGVMVGRQSAAAVAEGQIIAQLVPPYAINRYWPSCGALAGPLNRSAGRLWSAVIHHRFGPRVKYARTKRRSICGCWSAEACRVGQAAEGSGNWRSPSPRARPTGVHGAASRQRLWQKAGSIARACPTLRG